MSDGAIRIKTIVDNSGAKEDLKELSNLVDEYAEKMDGKDQIAVSKIVTKYQELVAKQNEVNAKADVQRQKIQEIEDTIARQQALGIVDPKLNEELSNASLLYEKLSSQSDILNQKISQIALQADYFTKTWRNANIEVEKTPTAFDRIKQGISKVCSVASKTGSAVMNMGSSLWSATKRVFNLRSGFDKVNNSVGSGVKKILRYGLALFSLRSIYGVLSNLANTFLNSGTEQANQLKSNIEYMKNSLGSALAPAIEFIVNLVAKLLGMLNTVLQTFFGINLFAKQTSDNMSSGAASAKEISKLKTGFDEMETLGSSKNGSSSSGNVSVTPDIDVSGDLGMKKLADKIKELWEQQDYYGIGAEVANQINKGFEDIDWSRLGKTAADGINTLFTISLGFVSTLDWGKIGKSIADYVNNLLLNINWSTVAKTLSRTVTGFFDMAIGFVQGLNWKEIGNQVWIFITNIDWAGIVSGFFKLLGSLIGGLAMLLWGFIENAVNLIKDYFTQKIYEAGGNVAQGLFNGIIDGLGNIVGWLYNFVVKPFVDGICSLLGIHSPSTVLMEIGKNMILGLLNGFVGGIASIKNAAKEIVQTIQDAFKNIPNWFQTKFTDAWTKVKNVFSNGGSIFSGIKEGIDKTLKTVINKIIDGINTVISVPFNKINSMLNTIKTIEIPIIGQPFYGLWGWSPLSVPRIPKLAKGTVVNRPTQAIIGEAGKEAVVPLENNLEWLDTLKNMLVEAIGDIVGGDQVINLNIDGERLFRWFMKRMKQKQFVTNGGI